MNVIFLFLIISGTALSKTFSFSDFNVDTSITNLKPEKIKRDLKKTDSQVSLPRTRPHSPPSMSVSERTNQSARLANPSL